MERDMFTRRGANRSRIGPSVRFGKERGDREAVGEALPCVTAFGFACGFTGRWAVFTSKRREFDKLKALSKLPASARGVSQREERCSFANVVKQTLLSDPLRR